MPADSSDKTKEKVHSTSRILKITMTSVMMYLKPFKIL